MKAGAHDYIVKSSLWRLVPAVERELREADLRCSSVTYQFRYARPLTPVRLGPPCRRPILNATTSPLYARRCTIILPVRRHDPSHEQKDFIVGRDSDDDKVEQP
jgi:hypothetical protein